MKLFPSLFGRTPARATKARPAARCKPQLEGLEARALLAGNVTASVSGGDLIVNGDGLANSVSVWQDTSSGNWIVSGNYSAGALTTVNGQTVVINGRTMSFAVFSGVSDDVRIDLNGGADKLEMYGNYGYAVVPDDLEIDTDGGNDTVILHHLHVGNDLDLETGSDKDTVWLEHVLVGFLGQDGGNNDLDIDVGSGDDSVTLRYVQVDDDLRVYGEEAFEGYIGIQVDDYYSEAWRYPGMTF